jgi:hypothetical protein
LLDVSCGATTESLTLTSPARILDRRRSVRNDREGTQVMPRGGWNKGQPKVAGSGRKRGTPNKATVAHRKAIEQMKVDTSDPLSFFLSILQNPEAPFEEKKAAARELLPYSHPKLASVEARVGGMTHEDRLEELQAMLDKAPRLTEQ